MNTSSFVLFGLVGVFGMELDIISAPAANVALPLGIDEMIHLGYSVRRSRTQGVSTWQAWSDSLKHLWGPVLASMLIVTSGFALFLISDFPPTRRLGILVCADAAITDLGCACRLAGDRYLAPSGLRCEGFNAASCTDRSPGVRRRSHGAAFTRMGY